MIIEKFDLYAGMVVAGVFTGLGVALGSYLAQRHLIKTMEKFTKKIKNGIKNGRT
ncbi:MAG: hypothetical protein AB1571_00360 [Nanoarchaeota archaeon]